MSRLQVLRWMLIPSLYEIDKFRSVPADKEEVQAFWTQNPNLINEAHSESSTPRFFEEVDSSRKKTHWPLYDIVPFSTTRGLDVLEVGCGLGTDAVEFAKSGARYTGIDLTEPAVELTREKLAAYGLPGTTTQADAEQLPFPDESFDVVYSWGVIHHTPDTDRCVDEIFRVLRPGGKLILMLYHAHGWWEYRIRFHWRLLSLLRFRAAAALVTQLGADKQQVLKFRSLYLENPVVLRERYTARETDGGGNDVNPHSKLYTKGETRRLLSRFEDVSLKAAHWIDMPTLAQILGAKLYRAFMRSAGSLNGSCLYAFARKPLASSRQHKEQESEAVVAII